MKNSLITFNYSLKGVLVLLILVLMNSMAFSQKLKTIEKKQKEYPYYAEKYQVLKNDKSIRQGKYEAREWNDYLVIEGQYLVNKKSGTWTTYFYDSNKISKVENYKDDLLDGSYVEYSESSDGTYILLNGNYVKGEKQGVWKEYFSQSNNLKSIGNYLNDKQIGVWEYYDSTDTLEMKYNHSDSTLVAFAEQDKYLEMIYTDSTSIEIEVDVPCLYIGGGTSKNHDVIPFVKYPELAKEKGAEGRVIVAFIVNADATVSRIHIQESDSDLLNNCSLEAVKQVKGKWLPAIKDGKKISTIQSITLNYKLY